MVDLIGLGILILIYVVCKNIFENKLNNYNMSKISHGKMAMDAGKKSPSEIRRNLVAGKYDKDDEWKI